MKDGNYWSSRNVVLLGGASLIGTCLAKRLVALGVKGLRIVDNLTIGKFTNIQELVDKYDVEFHLRDLREYTEAERSVCGADIVFHLASQHGGRGYVSGHAVELYDNLSLDTTIFRACSEEHVEKVIFSSSACAYPTHLQSNPEELIKLSEDMIDYKDTKQADGPYGTEKLIGEQMLDAYIERGDFKGCSTRSFTVYGELMNESSAIAALIAKTMIRQNPFEIWGDGFQIRDWVFVEDNVSGALLAAENLDKGAINIGTESRLTPMLACEHIWSYFDWRPAEVRLLKDKPVGPLNRVSDSTKLKSLGWEPKYSFEEGLRKTIEWYVDTHDVEELRKNLERKLTER